MNSNFSAALFLRNRAFFLIVPMFCFLAFYFLGYYLIILDEKIYGADLLNLLLLNLFYLFLPSMNSSTEGVFMPHIWSLSYEFYFYIIALLIARLTRLGLVRFFALVSTGLLFMTLLWSPITHKGFIVNLVFFMCPWAIVRSQIFMKLTELPGRILRIINSIVTGLLFLVVCFGGKIQFIEYLCVTVALMLIVLDTIQKPVKYNRVLGRLTLYIYLSHLGVNYVVWILLPNVATVWLSLTSLTICFFVSAFGIYVEFLGRKSSPLKT